MKIKYVYQNLKHHSPDFLNYTSSQRRYIHYNCKRGTRHLIPRHTRLSFMPKIRDKAALKQTATHSRLRERARAWLMSTWSDPDSRCPNGRKYKCFVFLQSFHFLNALYLLSLSGHVFVVKFLRSKSSRAV